MITAAAPSTPIMCLVSPCACSAAVQLLPPVCRQGANLGAVVEALRKVHCEAELGDVGLTNCLREVVDQQAAEHCRYRKNAVVVGVAVMGGFEALGVDDQQLHTAQGSSPPARCIRLWRAGWGGGGEGTAGGSRRVKLRLLTVALPPPGAVTGWGWPQTQIPRVCVSRVWPTPKPCSARRSTQEPEASVVI